MNTPAPIQRIGDTPVKEEDILNRFDVHFTPEFRAWLSEESISLALTTYEGGKLIIVGPGLNGETIVNERNFERCMALHVEKDRNIWISTHHNIWQLENALEPGKHLNDQWDRAYFPRSSHITGGVDMHEIMKANDGHLYGVVTGHNCIARITHEEKGSFSPYWKPPFIDVVLPEDRCHLNGMCLENGELAYASMVSTSNKAGEWRKDREAGGLIMDMRTDEIVAEGLCMPHTPRMYNGGLWFLEAGKGYLCKLDVKTGEVERVLWRPGFLRGLHFYKDYAFICCSCPRDKHFEGLPLDQELKDRDQEAQCSMDIIDLKKMECLHSITITGHVKEIYDVAILENCRQPLLYGIFGEDIRKIVVYGENQTEQGALGKRSTAVN